MAKQFSKGEKVTLIRSWDNNGTVAYTQAIVYSCGNKQMVLTDSVTGTELGCHFTPEIGDSAKYIEFNWQGTFKLMTDDEAVESCLALGKIIADANRVRMNGHIARHADNKLYCESMRADIAKLHEPRAINRTGCA